MGVAAPAPRARRRRLPRRGDGPARLRRQRQDTSRLRPDDAGRRRRRGDPHPGRPPRRGRRPGVGRVRRLGGRGRSPGLRVGARAASRHRIRPSCVRTPARLRRARPARPPRSRCRCPWLPERRIRAADVRRPTPRALVVARRPSSRRSEEVDRYAEAFADWPSPHCALEYHRWLFRSRLRADGRAFGRLMRPALTTYRSCRSSARTTRRSSLDRRTPFGAARLRRLVIAPGRRDRGRRSLPARGAAGHLHRHVARVVGLPSAGLRAGFDELSHRSAVRRRSRRCRRSRRRSSRPWQRRTPGRR